MALTYTPTGELGSALPPFALTTVDGKAWTSKSIEGAGAKVVVFMCNHCPYVKAIEQRLIKLAKDLGEKTYRSSGFARTTPPNILKMPPKNFFARGAKEITASSI